MHLRSVIYNGHPSIIMVSSIMDERSPVKWAAASSALSSTYIAYFRQKQQSISKKGEIQSCLGYFVYLFQNQEVNDHTENLITICLIHERRRKGAQSVIRGALFGTDVSRSQYTRS